MAVAQLMHVFNVRKLHTFGFDKSFFKNKLLVGAMGLSVVLQLMVIYVPFFNIVFKTEALDLSTWGIIAATAILVTLIVYLIKRFFLGKEGLE